jgi:tetratricopeptide (TPR) repeat protein
MALARELGNPWLEGTSASESALVLCESGSYAEARKLVEGALALCGATHHRTGLGLATFSMGRVQTGLGNLRDALDQTRRSLLIGREIGPQLEAWSLVALGGILADLGDIPGAEEAAFTAHALNESFEHTALRGDCLRLQGRIAEAEGDTQKAIRITEAALAEARQFCEYRSIPHLLQLGRFESGAGSDLHSAHTHLDEALRLAREYDTPGPETLALARLALVGSGDVQAALKAFFAHEARLGLAERAEARFLLWEATDDPAHLEEAHRLLCYLRDHAPEEYRETMIENLPLHRDIMAAWREHGAEAV